MSIYSSYFGPSITAQDAVAEEARQLVRDDIAEVVRRYNRATDGTVAIEAEYLQTIAGRS